MVIPDKVNILGQEYAIEFMKKDKKRNFIGRCFPFNNKIQIDENLPSDKAGEVFFHEVLHAIDENLELDIKHRSINRLAIALYQFLKENNYLDLRPPLI